MVFLSGKLSKKGKKVTELLRGIELPVLCNVWVEGSKMSFGTHFILTGFHKEVLIGKEQTGHVVADIKIPIKDVKIIDFPDIEVRVEL